MKTLVWTGPNTMKVEQREIPSVRRDEILIRFGNLPILI
jgi:threonine dehydrogenase-like Zn-dependent dehydrogenase